MILSVPLFSILLPLSLLGQTASSTSRDSIFYVLQGAPESGLVKLSLGAQKVGVIATGVGDVAFMAIPGGGFLVLGKNSLHRVGLDGKVQEIIQGGSDSDWSAFALLDEENVVVMDQRSDWLLKVSFSGTLSHFAQIPHARKPSLVADLIKVGEMFYLFRLGDDEGLAFYRMDGLGAIQQIHLSGAVRIAGKPAYAIPLSADSGLAHGPGPLLYDGADGFYFVDIDTTRTLYHLSKSGVVERILRLDEIQPWQSRMMLDKANHRILIPRVGCLYAVDLHDVQKPRKEAYCNPALSNSQHWMLETR